MYAMPHLFSYMPTQLFALSKQVKVELHQQLSSKAESRDHRMMTVERVHVEFQEFPVSNCKLCHAGGTCHRLPIAKDNDVSIWIRAKNNTLPRLCNCFHEREKM